MQYLGPVPDLWNKLTYGWALGMIQAHSCVCGHWFKALTAPEKSAQVQRTHTTVFSSHSSLGLRPFIRLMVVTSKTYAFQY